MQMDAGLDTGPILSRRAVPIDETMTSAALHDQLAALGADMLADILPRLDRGEITPRRQPAAGATYAKKMARDEGRLDWSLPAVLLARQVRALNPWPGVWCLLGNSRLKVLSAAVVDRGDDGEPGTVLDHMLTVACGAGALRPLQVQLAGKAPMTAADFLRGHSVPTGDRLA